MKEPEENTLVENCWDFSTKIKFNKFNKMRNAIYLLLLTVVQLQINIDYYAYYYPDKNLLICSKEKYNTENMLFNEFEDDSGFNCLVNLKDGFYSINLNLSMVTEGNSYDLIDMSIGDNAIYNNIDLGGLDSDNFVEKHLFVKFENGKINYSTIKCDGDDCNFVEAKNAIINNDLLKLNFSLKKRFLREMVLLEKQNKLTKWAASEDCDPACVHGICSEGECLCEEGFSEKDCSKGILS
jgi:hypothetical protein